MIKFDKLWKTMEEKGITQYSLIKDHKISAGQLSRLRANESITTHTLDILCSILDCRIEDIAEHIQE